MTVEEFIDAHNTSFPTTNQIVGKFQGSDITFDEAKAIEYRNRNLIRFNEHLVPYSNQIEHLIYNTNISIIGIGAINFTSGIKIINSAYQRFASYNDFYLLCFDPTQGSIVSYSEEFSEYNIVSTSIEQFLTFLYLYERYDKNFIFGGDLVQSDLRTKLNNLILEGFSKDLIDELILKGLNIEP